MSLLLRPFLLLAALGEAVWLRFRSQPGPGLGGADQWRGRFRLAVWLAMAMHPALAQGLTPPVVTCYEMAPPQPFPDRPLSRVRMLWMALDPKQGPALEAALTAAIRGGDVTVPVSNLLLRVHRGLAAHRAATNNPTITCYRLSTEGARYRDHRESILGQLEALAKVHKAGRVAPEVLAQAEANIGAELRELGLKPPPGEKDARTVAHVLTTWYAEPGPPLKDLE